MGKPAAASASATSNGEKKPNILIIWGDDIGWFTPRFEQFPARQRPASFSIDQALEKARDRQAQLATASAGGSGTTTHGGTQPAAT